MNDIKYYFYQFDLTDDTSVRIKAESYDDAIRIFKVTFGEFLFSNVKTIYNLDYHA